MDNFYTIWWTCIPYTIPPARFIIVLLPHGDSNENQTTSYEICRCFATSWSRKRNPTILQGFVSLTCNYRSKKRQISFLLYNLRGRQVSYHLSIILCENLCNILFIYNKLSYIFINSVFHYHCEQLRAHRPDKWQRTHKQKLNYQALPTWYNQLTTSLTSKIQTTFVFCSGRNSVQWKILKKIPVRTSTL